MKMECPACQRDLTALVAGGLEVHACQGGCGGAWLAEPTLEKVEKSLKATTQALLEISRDKDIRVASAAKRPCPKCRGVRMMHYSFTVERTVEIDECGSCGGVWLDHDELRDTREIAASGWLWWPRRCRS
jgi:Zn-finger nucleic acid-binding protein